MRSVLLSLAMLQVLTQVITSAIAEENPLVRFGRGDLPIIVSAPHGGKLDVPNADVRRVEGLPTGGSGYVVSRDTGTEELLDEVVAAITRRFQRKPYFVVARSHRKFVDMNRPKEIAYEDPDAKPVYDTFHAALQESCRDVQKKFHKGLLLDLHGQGSARDTVFRGTQDGKTVTLLRERFGEPAHRGDASLFAGLKSLGWKVHPDPFDGAEQAGFRGGYIVQTYGSHQGFGIDAMQLEFGADYRSSTARKKTAATLTAAIADYAVRYLDLKVPADDSVVDEPADGLAPVNTRIHVGVYMGAGTGDSRAKLDQGTRHGFQLAGP